MGGFIKQRCQVDKLNRESGQHNTEKQEHLADRVLQEMLGFTDKALLKEFEEAEKDWKENGNTPELAPPPDEFGKIWERIMGEEEDTQTEELADAAERTEKPGAASQKVIQFRFRWKRLAATGLLAVILTGGICIVALGTKSYFFRPRVVNGNEIVYNNDDNLETGNGEEKAYEEIERQLGIKALKLGYMPEQLRFEELRIQKQYAELYFWYNERMFYITQMKFDAAASVSYVSDAQENERYIYNKWLNKKIEVRTEQTDEGIRCEAMFTEDGAYYRITGVMEIEEFNKILERMYL